MSYLVLARKWRPQNFDELIGQESVAVSLKNALARGTVAHAYLFSGPRGVGKTSTARILASALNCTETATFQPCGTCHNCRAIATSSSVDVLEIDGASNNSVDNIRELRETVKYAPSACKYKIYIIDEIHMLTDQAFNALLKTLEEPPPHVIFIFATTSPKKIPPTILSRCQHFIFKKVKKSTIKDHLEKIAQKENIQISPTALEMLARSADGCMRDALTLLDQISSFSDEISEKEIHLLLGLPDRDIVDSLAEAIIEGNVSQCLVQIRDLTEKGFDFRTLTRELVEYFRNIAIMHVVKEPDKILDFTPDEIERTRKLSSMATMEELTLFLDEFLKIETQVKNASFPRYVFELGIVKASFIKGMAPVGEILKALSVSTSGDQTHSSALKRLAHIPQSPEKTSSTAASQNIGSDSRTNIALSSSLPENQHTGLWKQVISALEKSNQTLAWFLASMPPASISDSEILFDLKGGMNVYESHFKKHAQDMEKAFHQVTGRPIKVRIQATQEVSQREILKKDALSNPVVKQLMEQFDGKVINVKLLS